ncbi:phage tail protein [Nocardia sp. GCM10030253]|uniref:phage tail protein n=1 Tax=Nocardia sp. GCM10030253 TaxID=3273404 RepID=UPI00363D6563
MRTQDKISTGTFRIALDNFVVETVHSVSGLGNGQDHKRPGAEPGREVTITRSMDKSKIFTDWIQQSLQDHNAARKNITITMLDNYGKPYRQISLANAWVSTWNEPSFNAGNSGPADEKVSLCYDEMKVE